ncbi:MAG: transglutaminase domain-containing protein, partial [Oscillospiraceae bacterium]|nr:transglutaminase domain-containing protein [Oscillospiraceae bacterium]
VIDYSNTSDGYVMINYTASTTKKLKVKITGPSSVDYTYNLTAGQLTTFPLSDGNGSYTIKVYENTTGNKYATVLSLSTSVVLNDEFAPFLRPNQYVNYTASSKAVAKAKELTANAPTALDKVGVIYDYVVKNYTYDKEKAATVQSGYLPDLDKVMAAKKGICFDYAALMTAMLRSQNVPCKLVVGYAGTAYHAWINVWSENTGWVEGVVYFDGTAWQRMDPTFASSGKQSASIMQYIGDGKNYTEKYLY